MYSFNNISLDTFGFIAGRAENSNLAISGVWDMPSRLGKTSHLWGDDHGVEPYVREDEIMFGGRDLALHGYIKGDSKVAASAQLNALYEMINGVTDLVPLSSDWGAWLVYVSDEISAEYIAEGVYKIRVPMREPSIAQLSPPQAPTNLQADISDEAIELTWFDNSVSETGFLIQRKSDGGDWEDLATVGVNVIGHSDDNNVF